MYIPRSCASVLLLAGVAGAQVSFITPGDAVHAESTATGHALLVYALTKPAIYAHTEGGWACVIADNDSHGAYGLHASADPPTGVGASSPTYGVYTIAYGQSAKAIYASAFGTPRAKTSQLAGVYGVSMKNGYAVFAMGDTGATGSKSFIQPHPRDPSRVIQFVCLEGNESGTYFRGRTRLRGGRAEISIPEEWTLASEEHGITVQLTPIRSLARLAAWEVSRDRIEVRGDQDCEFSYLVNGVRRGFADYQPFLDNTGLRPEIRGVPFAEQLPDDLRNILVSNGTLNADYTPNEATAARHGWKLIDPESVPLTQRWWLSREERARRGKSPPARRD